MKLCKKDIGLGGGSLLQIANRTPVQMMSYLIETPDGKTVVIDGGNFCREDAENLYSLLCSHGKNVDLWFITHAHSDHLGALAFMLESTDMCDINIGKLCFDFPDMEWFEKKEPRDAEIAKKLSSGIERCGISVVKTHAGDFFESGGMKFEILNDAIIEEHFPTVNPTGIVIKAHFPERQVLFLGDLDAFSENIFAERYGTQKLRCDIVQMAHHGQKGVTKSFYQYIMPKHCLYCAPQWLWENNNYKCDDPETVGKGPFTTLQTRAWMDELGAEASYTHADGDWLLF